MSDIGCLMTDPMMRAVLSNDKDVTRRIGKTWARAKVGDRLWFREVWKPDFDVIGIDEGHLVAAYSYRCDGAFVPIPDTDEARKLHDALNVTNRRGWRSSLLMPRSVCRATGIITSIGRTRLQDIDEADAIREGMGTLTWADVVALASGRTLRSTLVKLMMAWDSPPAVDSHGTEIEQREWFGRISMRDRFRLGFSLIHSHEIWQMNPLVWRVEWRRE